MTTADVERAYQAVLSDADTSSWLLVEGQKNGTLVLKAQGVGGLKEATAGFADELVQHAWVRLIRTDGGGDSKRVKFVLLSWTGESAGVMAKARLTEHRAWLDAHLRPTHVTMALTERAALATLDADVDAALRAAGGADYDAGNAAAGVVAGASGSIKSSSKAFFQQKDAETQIKGIQFEKHTRADKKVSACDLGNRVMTASATEARRNTVGYMAPKVASGAIASGRRAVTEPSDRPLRHNSSAAAGDKTPRASAAEEGEEEGASPQREDEVYELGESEEDLVMPDD